MLKIITKRIVTNVDVLAQAMPDAADTIDEMKRMNRERVGKCRAKIKEYNVSRETIT